MAIKTQKTKDRKGIRSQSPEGQGLTDLKEAAESLMTIGVWFVPEPKPRLICPDRDARPKRANQ